MNIDTLPPKKSRESGESRKRRRFSKEKMLKVVSGADLLEKLGDKEVNKDNILKTFKGEKLTRVLERLRYKNRPGSRREKAKGFEPFENAADEILSLTDEPIAIFGSLAIFKRRLKSNQDIPDDVDIATTPKGAEELFDALKKREKEQKDILITEDLEVHDAGGPLAALRFAGYLIHDGSTHPFEVFGEGGKYKGVEYQGLFQLGDKKNNPVGLIEDDKFTPRSLKVAYERLKSIGDNAGGGLGKRRTMKIEKLKDEIANAEDHLIVEELRRRLAS